MSAFHQLSEIAVVFPFELQPLVTIKDYPRSRQLFFYSRGFPLKLLRNDYNKRYLRLAEKTCQRRRKVSSDLIIYHAS